MKITPLDAEHRIQLPVEWVVELGLEQGATLEKVTDGILILPPKRLTWDEVFTGKLTATQNKSEAENFEVSGDDLLY